MIGRKRLAQMQSGGLSFLEMLAKVGCGGILFRISNEDEVWEIVRGRR